MSGSSKHLVAAAALVSAGCLLAARFTMAPRSTYICSLRSFPPLNAVLALQYAGNALDVLILLLVVDLTFCRAAKSSARTAKACMVVGRLSLVSFWSSCLYPSDCGQIASAASGALFTSFWSMSSGKGLVGIPITGIYLEQLLKIALCLIIFLVSAAHMVRSAYLKQQPVLTFSDCAFGSSKGVLHDCVYCHVHSDDYCSLGHSR